MAELALVTGGAGLIGSHLVDALLARGWRVRVLDSLEPQTHGGRVPPWIAPEAELRRGDVRDGADVRRALEGVDVVFHLAAYGGYMPEIAHYVDVNSLGTARLFEAIRERGRSVRKVVVASSQAVYVEGAVRCPADGLRFPGRRRAEDLARGRFDVPCPVCGGPAATAPTPEHAPVGGETVYALTKVDQERLALIMGAQLHLPVVALRYACTYGPRQSPFNPYTGVISIFAGRLAHGLAPVVFEDGAQVRDLCYVGDVARANVLAAETDALDGRAVNVGTGRPTRIADLARALAAAMGVRVEPDLRGQYRPGEMRALVPDLTLVRGAGFEAEVGLEDGVRRYLEWRRAQGPIEERFDAAERRMAEHRVLQRPAAR